MGALKSQTRSGYAAAWMALMLTWPVLAGPPAAGEFAPETGLIIPLTDPAPSSQGDLEEALGMDASTRIIAELIPATTFVDALRRRLVPSLRPEPLQFREKLCAGKEGTLASLLEKAEQDLEFGELDNSDALLERAWNLLACNAVLVQQEQLTRVLVDRSLIRVIKGQDGSDLLEQALVIDPMLAVPAKYAAIEAFQHAFARAQDALSLHSVVRVNLDSDLAGLELWVDGTRFEGATRWLYAGQHVLQLARRDGSVVSTTVITVRAPGTANRLPWPPNDLAPPDRESVIAQLETAVASGEMRGDLADALDEVMKDGAHPWAVFLPDPASRRPALWVYPGHSYRSREVAGRPGPASSNEPGATSPERHTPHPGRKVTLETRLGAGVTLMKDFPSVPGGAVELDVVGSSKHGLMAGIFVKGAFESVGNTTYPGLTLGILGSARIHLAGAWHLRPGAGYAAGTGPALDVRCSLAGSEASRYFVCPARADATDTIDGLVFTLIHGPVLRLEVERPLPLRASSLSVGLQGQYALGMVVPDRASVSDVTLGYIWNTDVPTPRSLRLELLIGFRSHF